MDVLNLMESYAPMMASSGLPAEWTKRLQAEAVREIQEQKLHSHGKWRWMWCRRRDCEWIPKS
ncbi:hypothetical protein FRC03_000172 [Tulasnella sp. 419]|nr:hypothetical protein FRC03_000172 [Tulasnella sp. 419]